MTLNLLIDVQSLVKYHFHLRFVTFEALGSRFALGCGLAARDRGHAVWPSHLYLSSPSHPLSYVSRLIDIY